MSVFRAGRGQHVQQKALEEYAGGVSQGHKDFTGCTPPESLTTKLVLGQVNQCSFSHSTLELTHLGGELAPVADNTTYYTTTTTSSECISPEFWSGCHQCRTNNGSQLRQISGAVTTLTGWWSPLLHTLTRPTPTRHPTRPTTTPRCRRRPTTSRAVRGWGCPPLPWGRARPCLTCRPHCRRR